MSETAPSLELNRETPRLGGEVGVVVGGVSAVVRVPDPDPAVWKWKFDMVYIGLSYWVLLYSSL